MSERQRKLPTKDEQMYAIGVHLSLVDSVGMHARLWRMHGMHGSVHSPKRIQLFLVQRSLKYKV